MDTILEARTLLARVLDVPVDVVGDKDSLHTLKAWDSLAHIRIILELELVSSSDLTTEQVLSIEGVTDIAQLLGILQVDDALPS